MPTSAAKGCCPICLRTSSGCFGAGWTRSLLSPQTHDKVNVVALTLLLGESAVSFKPNQDRASAILALGSFWSALRARVSNTRETTGSNSAFRKVAKARPSSQ